MGSTLPLLVLSGSRRSLRPDVLALAVLNHEVVAADVEGVDRQFRSQRLFAWTHNFRSKRVGVRIAELDRHGLADVDELLAQPTPDWSFARHANHSPALPPSSEAEVDLRFTNASWGAVATTRGRRAGGRRSSCWIGGDIPLRGLPGWPSVLRRGIRPDRPLLFLRRACGRKQRDRTDPIYPQSATLTGLLLFVQSRSA